MKGPRIPGAARDAVRLVIGTLSVLPTRPPGRVDRTVAGWAMASAPLVGAALFLVAALLLALLGWAPTDGPLPLGPLDDLVDSGPYLAAALVVGLLALLTRAMHLDGLADTADGLGSGRPRSAALEVMRRGDVGPFGVVTLVLALLLQVLALGELLQRGIGVPALLLALVVSRLALPLACTQEVPAAREDGLGQVVAGAVGRVQLAVAVVLGVGLTVPLAVLVLGHTAIETRVVLRAALAAAVGLLAARLLVRRAVGRLGGVTGDVLGAAVESAFTTVLVVVALGT